MGGSVAITLREPDGKETRMVRWTNIMPHFICNTKMINGNRDHIDEFLLKWQEMKLDWEMNHESEKFDNAMTKFYVPYDGQCLYPVEYGLVVVDLQKNHLLSYQDYTNFTRISAAKLHIDVFPHGYDPRYNESFPPSWDKALMLKDSAATRLKGFYDENRIERIGNWSAEPTVEYSIPQSFVSFRDSVCDMQTYVDFYLDLSPLSVLNYRSGDPDAACQMLDTIKSLDFKLSSNELEMWKSHIKKLKNRDY